MTLSLDLRLSVGDFRLESAFDLAGGIGALFGPSGAGKTLTLRCIAGLASPDEGRIVLRDRVLCDTRAGIDLPARSRRIGYVFQQYAIFPHLTVERNIAFGIVGVSRKERKERVDSLLELVGLPGYGKRPAQGLSGGQQQRIALARALATEPDLLLLDEPFAAVDWRLRRRLRDELRRLHETTGTPMLLVTHDLSEVRQLADTLIIIDDGKVVGAGSTDSLLADPIDPSISTLLED